jgi:putative PEP-CTERM system TPR-repeat lipoprotein
MKIFCLILILSSLLIISGCSKNTSDEYIALAETNIQQNDIPTAIIELKNAIGVNPQDPRSRFMLGNLYAESGRAVAAEKELTRASKLGYEPNEVLPVLAKVYSLQFKHAEIIKLVEDSRNIAPEVSTSLLLYKALAHFQLSEPYKAKKAVADANEISSDSIYSKLGSAYVDFSNKQIATSLEKINEILKAQPDFADAHLLKGQLTSVSDDKVGSVKSFEQYKSLLPDTYQSRVLLANAYIKNNQFEEAEKEVDLLLNVYPEQPFLNQLKGTVRFQAKDFSNAKKYMELAIQNGLSSGPNSIIAGISAFRLGAHEQAYKYLYSVKNNLPPKHPILKTLAVLELKLGVASGTELLLTSLDGLTEDDVILLSAASAQLMKEGKTAQQQTILDQVDSIEFSDPLRMAQKGILRLSLDDIDGLTDLEQALLMDPDQDVANTALARAYLDNELYDKALALSRTWITQKPQEVYGYILAAVSNTKLKKIDLAEDLYNQVLTLDPNNIQANTYYADKAEAQGNKESAVAYLTKIINGSSGHISSMRKYFALQLDLGNPEEGVKPIVTAFEQAPEKMPFRLLYAQALLTQGQYAQSISVLEQVTPNETSPDKYWVVLGNAYFFNQQPDKATDVAASWMSAQPNNKAAYLRLIALHDIANNNIEALITATLAQQRFSTEAQFSMLVTYFTLVTGDIKGAERSYESLPESARNSVAGQGLLGQILLEEGDAKSALPMLKAFYGQKASQANAALVAKALKALKQYSQAIGFLQAHQMKMGKSVTNYVQIAELAIVSGNFELAVKQYRLVINDDPNNTRALNNLAYILMEQGYYQEALAYAERAVKYSPDYPPIQDTYGTALFKNGQYAAAVSVFKELYLTNKDNNEVALRYAEAMISDKKIDLAKKLLTNIETKQDLSIESKQKLLLLKGQI